MHCKSYSHFFSKKFQHICVSLDVNFNESLTNDVVSFEQLGPGNKLYSSLVDACSTGANACNWAKNVKSLLDKYGFSFVWSNRFSVDLKTSHLQFKRRVLDVFKQSWYNDIANNRVLTLNKNYKLSFDFEHYLNVLPNKLRVTLSRLRLSSHQLRIETERYSQNRVDRAQRICTLCNKSDN